MKMKKLIYYPLLLFMSLLLLYSCAEPNNKNDKSTQNEPVDMTRENEVDLSDEDESIIYLFPSPGEVLERFYNSDMNYTPDLLNPVSNKDKYLTTRAKALNLGIYLTDFAYLTVFERHQEAIDYLEALNTMSKQVNISAGLYESLVHRTENNLGNRDSLLSISRDMFFSILQFLEEGEMHSTIALVSAGSYIEAMHIALQSVEEFKENDPILKNISELSYPMQNLLHKAKSSSNDPHIKSILVYLLEINEVFEELESVSEDSDVLKNQDNELSIVGGKEFEMNEENFNKLKAMIAEIRENIIRK